MEADRAVSSPTQAAGPQGWSAASFRQGGACRHSVCAQDRYPMGVLATGDGLWLRHELLAAAPGLEEGRRLGPPARDSARKTPGRRQNRLVPGGGGLDLGASHAPGKKTGPSPVDRRKYGTKHTL